MAVVQWDKVGDRTYETGLDRGVLYLPDGSAVPWNGLTSVIEKFDKEASPVYFDGKKINDLVALGDFSASMKAVTYPEEFEKLEGWGSVKNGVFYADQKPQCFGLCYRTQIGNDLVGDVVGYKIHIVYNVTAIPTDKTYATLSDGPSLVEFQWEITAVPEDIPGFRPTAHIIIDTRNIDPWLLEELEELLYGSSNAAAALIPMPELVERLRTWYRVQIIDNGDGTWTAIAHRDGFIFVDAFGYFEIVGVNAIYLDEFTYLLSDTDGVVELPEIHITDNGNGTWTASSDNPDVIVMVDETTAVIREANIQVIDVDTYQISDTLSED